MMQLFVAGFNGPRKLRNVMKRHAYDKQSNAYTHCNEPTARLRIHDLTRALLRGQPQRSGTNNHHQHYKNQKFH
jgi:hypothetical protein